jgi:hypothetical protein
MRRPRLAWAYTMRTRPLRLLMLGEGYNLVWYRLKAVQPAPQALPMAVQGQWQAGQW